MALPVNRDFDPRHGEAVEIAPAIRRVTAANVGPYSFQGTNTYLLGTGEVTVVDPGPADDAHLDALMRAIDGAAAVHILLTHKHRDHSAAAPRLRALTGATIFAAAPEGDAVRLADATLEGGIEVVATPGHASDHVVFAVPAQGVILSGDHVMGWSTTIIAPPDGSMAAYMASLDRLLARPEQLYLPGHGPAIPASHTYVRALKMHREARARSILAALAAGDRTIPEIVARVYPGISPALQKGASLSALAHLEHLSTQGLVHADGPPTLSGTYRPA